MHTTIQVSKKRKILILIILCVFGFFASNCNTIPKQALVLSEQSLEWRQMQSRKYETNDEEKIIVACSNLLQDLGFTIVEAETKLGVIVGTKDRSAVDGGQVVGTIFLALLTGVASPIDKEQKFKASVITRPYGENKEEVIVRVTFQRIVWNTQGQITQLERLNDIEMYQEFFSKLSKAIFLDAHEI